MKVDVWHNIMWSRYKAKVFSELAIAAKREGVDLHVYQIAETEGNRVGLSSVDKSLHDYDYTLLFDGAIDKVPRMRRMMAIAGRTWVSKADVIVLAGYEQPEYWLQLFLVKLRGRKAAVFCDSTALDRPANLLKSGLKAIFFALVDRVFCYGQRAKDYVMSFGVPAAKISFRCQAAALPNDYDASTIVERRQAARSAQPPRPRLLYVGRLSPEKYLHVLIEAMRRYVQASPRAQLVIVGTGPQEGELRKLVQRLQLGDNIVFAGAKSGVDLFTEYLAASVFVLPSYSEPWGLVVNEALSHGCPVVVSERCGCVPELVINGVTGFSYDCGNADALFSALTKAEMTFGHTAVTAENCLKIIGYFTPTHAANDILNGLVKTVSKPT